MMDAVYVVRPGENNAPLRYSLRSLQNVHHGHVWIFGHAPSWVTNAWIIERPRTGSKYETVTEHIKAACLNPDVSDPFMLWNDDFYAVEHIGPMPNLHRGSLVVEMRKFAKRRDEWARGLRGAWHLASGTALCYELHVPIIVHKPAMLDAIAQIRGAGIPSACRRTVYGNIARLGGLEIADVKMNRDWPSGSWVSSNPATFNLRAKPHLQRLFPAHGRYETASESVFSPSPVLAPTENLPEPQIGAQTPEKQHDREEMDA